MASSVARNIIRGWRRRHETGVFVEGIPLLTAHGRQHQQQRRSYPFFTSSQLLAKTKTTHSHLPFSTSSSSSKSSSSSSSSKYKAAAKVGFLKWYLGMLETRPFITKGISSSLIFTAADFTSQMITLPTSGSFDSARTLRIAGYGLLIMGPSQHLWFNYLSRIFPKRDVFTTFKKIIMGQAIFGPIMNSIFFSYNAALRGETKEDIAARLKRDLLPTLKAGVMYWPLCDFLMFKFTPVHLQVGVSKCFRGTSHGQRRLKRNALCQATIHALLQLFFGLTQAFISTNVLCSLPHF